MNKYFLFLAILSIPLQFLGFQIRGAILDISPIFILLWLIFRLPRPRLAALIIIMIIFASLGVASPIIMSNDLTFPRIVMPSIFYAVLILPFFATCPLRSSDINVCWRALLLASLIAFLSPFFFSGQTIMPNPFANLTKGGFFDETSSAGLFYYSLIAASIISLLFCRARLLIALLTFAISASVFTRSAHLLTLLLALSLILSPLISDAILTSLKRSALSKRLVTVVLVLSLAISIFYLLFTRIDYLSSRLATVVNPASVGELNLSSLVWISGYRQALASLIDCPIIGCGPGSPGVFNKGDFYLSDYILSDYYLNILQTLNIHDCYSLLFRSIVELGPFVLFLWAIILGRYTQNLLAYAAMYGKASLKSYRPVQIKISMKVLFIGCFLLTMVVGSLVKEPHLTRSITFTPIALLGVWSSYMKSSLDSTELVS